LAEAVDRKNQICSRQGRAAPIAVTTRINNEMSRLKFGEAHFADGRFAPGSSVTQVIAASSYD
jgi:hypothetical protein